MKKRIHGYMRNGLIILSISIASVLTGCILDTSSDKSSGMNLELDIEGTWYGTMTNRMTVSWSNFNSATEGEGEAYWVIKRKDDGSYDFPNCRGENKDVEVVGNTFVFNNVEYTVEGEDTIHAEINNSDSGQHRYYSIELNRVNKSTETIGALTGTWSNLNETTRSDNIVCAEITSSSLTTSNGDNMQQVTAFVGDGKDFSYLSTRTGTDTYDYVQIEYGDNELHGFSYNGFEEMQIDYDRSPEKGFNVAFLAKNQEAELSGNIVIEIKDY